MHCPVYGGRNSLVLRNGCELLKKKNNQIIKRIRFYKYLFRPICPENEYGVLDNEMYSVRRNPRLYYIALGQIQHSTHKCYASKEMQIDC